MKVFRSVSRAPLLTVSLLLLCTSCAAFRSGVQRAYNINPVGRIAKELVGKQWVSSDEVHPKVAYSGRLTVLFFFDPAASASAGFADELVALHTEFEAQGVVFLGVTDAPAQRLEFFTNEHPLPFPILTEAPADRVNFQIKKLYQPEILVVDPYQRIVAAGLDDTRNWLRSKF